MLLAIVLAVLGWSGLGYLIVNIRPVLFARGAFLVLWAIALLGTAWPVLLALHRRFRGEPSPAMVWRQSAWVGLIGASFAWLQMYRLLTMASAAIVACLFVVVEIILYLRARQETSNDE